MMWTEVKTKDQDHLVWRGIVDDLCSSCK